MLMTFTNPENGRFFYMIQHFENEKVVLTIIRGGKTRRVLENHIYDDIRAVQKEIDKRAKKRIRHGYQLLSQVAAY